MVENICIFKNKIHIQVIFSATKFEEIKVYFMVHLDCNFELRNLFSILYKYIYI